METRTIEINPVTRIEGHGKVTIFLDAQGQVDDAGSFVWYPDLRQSGRVDGWVRCHNDG